MDNYKEIEDQDLVKFIKNNTTKRTRNLLDIKIGKFGLGNEVKIKEENYSVIVELFLNAKALGRGKAMKGKLDLRPNSQ